MTRRASRAGTKPEPVSESVPLLDPSIIDQDHLRLPRTALIELGQTCQVLGSLIYLAGGAQGHGTFASLRKISKVALVSIATTQRALKRLITTGWIHRHGRQQAFATGKVRRRTVTYSLSDKAILAATEDNYFKLPRQLVGAFQNVGRPLVWAERVLLAYLVSRYTLVKALARDGTNAEDRNFHSHRILMRDTGLSRNSVKAGLRSLEKRQLVIIEPDWDQAPSRGNWITLNDRIAFFSRHLPLTAAEGIRTATVEPAPNPNPHASPSPSQST